MAIIYISHPYSSNPQRSRAEVTFLAHRLALSGHLPLAPQIYFPEFLEEKNERDLVLRLCLKLVALTDELHVYGFLSEGVRLEIAEAHRLGIPVVEGKIE